MNDRKALSVAALVVSAGILLSRLLGFLRDVVMAALLGRGLEADLYANAFLIPDYLFFLMAGGYLSITLVPILIRAESESGESEFQTAFRSVFSSVGTLLVVLTLAALFFARPITAAIFSAVPDPERLTGLTRIALGSQVFFGLGSLLMAAQYAKRRFLIPTLAPLVYNLGIIVGGLAGAWAGNPTPESFLWGGLIGAGTGNFALQWFGARRSGVTLLGSASWRHSSIRQYLTMALPLMVGQSVVALDEQWPRLFGQFIDEGTTAGLAYARRLTMVPIGVIAQAAGVAAYPFLALLVARGDRERLSDTVSSSARAAWTLGAFAAATLAGLSVPIVRLVFQRGEFTAGDTSFVAPLLAVYAISIPFWGAHQVVTRAFYAERRMWVPVLVGSGLTLVTVPALVLGAAMDSALVLAAVSSTSIAAYALIIIRIWKRRHPTSFPSMGKALIAAGVAYLAAYATSGLVGSSTPSAAALSVASGVAAAGVAFWASARALGIPEANALLSRLLRELR